MAMLEGQWQATVDDKGNVTSPGCCNTPMKYNGGCSTGCCDDYKCEVCGKTIRIEWPD